MTADLFAMHALGGLAGLGVFWWLLDGLANAWNPTASPPDGVEDLQYSPGEPPTGGLERDA